MQLASGRSYGEQRRRSSRFFSSSSRFSGEPLAQANGGSGPSSFSRPCCRGRWSGALRVSGLPRRTFASLKLGRTGDGLTTAQAELVDDLLQRWPELDSARRTRLATTLLRRLDPDFPAGTTVSADEEALLRRLRALVAPPA